MAPMQLASLLLISTVTLLLVSQSQGLHLTRLRTRLDTYDCPAGAASTQANRARSWAPWQATAKSDTPIPPIDNVGINVKRWSAVETAVAGDVAATESLKLSTLDVRTTTFGTPMIDSAPDVDVILSEKGKKRRHAKAYWSLLRPSNIPASFGLVAAGALVASHSVASLLDAKVIFTAVAAASISVGSCVLNDWFDVELDRINKPDRPLVTGEVAPQHALVIGLAFLVAAIFSASAVHPAALQATIIASVALTSVYTPLLKPVPLVKNFVVAAVIAAAIASGGLAAGAGVTSTIAPTCLTFFVIAHREILMDIGDLEGDRDAGIRTLPVLLGRETSLTLASLLLTAGVGGAGMGILSSDSTAASTSIAAGLCFLFTMPLYANITRVGRSNFSTETLAAAVEQALGPLALILGLMGFALS